MARLRLFANLREAAGAATVEVPGTSVGEIVDQAVSRYGPEFGAGLPHAKVWVNGEPADRDTVVSDADEVALIPPVSGGALAVHADAFTRLFMAGALVAALLAASFASLRVFVVIVVAVVAAWVWDLAGHAVGRGVALNLYPLLVAVVAPAWGAYRWGFDGFAFAAMLGLVTALLFGLFWRPYRMLDSLAGTAFASLVVAAAAGPLVLLRMRSADDVSAFIIVVVASVAASWIATAYGDRIPALDANIAGLAGAIIGGAIAGAFFGSSFVAVLLASVVAAVGLVAGRTIGSLLRDGRILLADAAPGYLTLLDGPLFAVGLFWVTLALFA